MSFRKQGALAKLMPVAEDIEVRTPSPHSRPPAAVANSEPKFLVKKNDGLQILRAIAALLVVYAHSIDLVEAHGIPKQIRFYYLENFGACGVDIFFAISGLILSTVILRTKPDMPNKAFDFIMRRYIRILPIYWIISLYYVSSGVKRHNLAWGRLFNSYLLFPSFHFPMHEPFIPLGWTLIFEMFFYYVLTLNLLFGKRAVIPRAIISILLLIGLGAVVGFQRPILILIANPVNIEFVLGCCVALLYSKIGSRPALGSFLLWFGGLALGMTVIFGYGDAGDSALTLNGELSWYRVGRWGIAAAVLTAGFVFRSIEVRSGFGRLWVYLGDASYSIYLASSLTLLNYDHLYRFVAAVPPDLNIFLAMFTVAVLGSAMYSFVERPITQYITRRYQQARMLRLPVAGRVMIVGPNMDARVSRG
jgi:exopolysaccharide production protein ExoZ